MCISHLVPLSWVSEHYSVFCSKSFLQFWSLETLLDSISHAQLTVSDILDMVILVFFCCFGNSKKYEDKYCLEYFFARCWFYFTFIVINCQGHASIFKSSEIISCMKASIFVINDCQQLHEPVCLVLRKKHFIVFFSECSNMNCMIIIFIIVLIFEA